MTVWLNDVCYIAVVEFGCVCSRILWVNLNFSKFKVCVVEDDEEREKSWNYLYRVLGGVTNGYRLCVIGDLN